MSIRIFLARPFLSFARALTIAGTMGAVLVMALPAFAQTGCQTGASALANAAVRANPLYALYYGDLESYVANNSQQFMAGADAVRCARALSQALIAGGIQAFDPADFQKQQQLNTQFQTMGMSPGAPQPSPATQLYMMGQNFARLARVLPPAALGDYGPLRTPTTELEQMQMFAGQMLQSMMDQSTLEYIRPLIKEAAQLEYKIITDLAAALAAQ